MSRVLTISDTLYAQLDSIRDAQGLTSIEELLEQSIENWQEKLDDLNSRQETVALINELREKLFAKYGEQEDSVALIRADRDR